MLPHYNECSWCSAHFPDDDDDGDDDDHHHDDDDDDDGDDDDDDISCHGSCVLALDHHSGSYLLAGMHNSLAIKSYQNRAWGL